MRALFSLFRKRPFDVANQIILDFLVSEMLEKLEKLERFQPTVRLEALTGEMVESGHDNFP